MIREQMKEQEHCVLGFSAQINVFRWLLSKIIVWIAGTMCE